MYIEYILLFNIHLYGYLTETSYTVVPLRRSSWKCQDDSHLMSFVEVLLRIISTAKYVMFNAQLSTLCQVTK